MGRRGRRGLRPRVAPGVLLLFAAVLAAPTVAAAFDADATFAKGTTIFGLQVGGGVENNIERGRHAGISFVNFEPRLSHLFFEPFGAGKLKGALETGFEGWFQYYLTPSSSTAEGLKLALRYHFIGLGPLVPYFELLAGAAGTSLRTKLINSTFTFVLEGGAGLAYFVTPDVAINLGYRFQHVSNGGTSVPNTGFNSDSGVLGVSFFFH